MRVLAKIKERKWTDKDEKLMKDIKKDVRHGEDVMNDRRI